MKALAGVAAIAALLLAACGEGASFPEPVACATPVPAASSTPRQAVNQYLSGVRAAVDRLATLRETLRNEYPGDKFSRDSRFRADFAVYADSTVCGAQNLIAVRPPSTNLAQFDDNLDGTLQALIDHTQAGRAAVKARNVSDYRTWYQGADVKLEAVKAAASQTGTR
ncbi:MAG: hypothetical protein ABI782_04695 [Anaerolineaceae bacterium]